MKQTHTKEEDSGSWIAWIVRDSSIATTDPPFACCMPRRKSKKHSKEAVGVEDWFSCTIFKRCLCQNKECRMP